MELIKRTTLHFQEGTSDKVYEVDLCRVGSDRYLVNFRYGKRGASLKERTKTTQAVPLAKAEQVFNKLVSEKTRKGYRDVTEQQPSSAPIQNPKSKIQNSQVDPRHEAILKRLENRDNENWPLDRVIWRAGELKIQEAVPLLTSLLGTDKPLRDYCIAAALGRCGGENAVVSLRCLHDNPSTPEFVKRIAWEALFKLADAATKEQMRSQKIEELPSPLQALVRNGNSRELSEALTSHLNTPIPIDPAVEAFQQWLNQGTWYNWRQDAEIRTEINTRIAQLPEEWRSRIPKVPELQVGHYSYWNAYQVQSAIDGYIQREKPKFLAVLDTLYQIDNEQTRPIIIELVRTASFQDTYTFQRLRHIFKMAEYRQDAEIFGIFAYRFEKEKSTYYRPYGNTTRQYLRRRVWRTLRKLGEEGDSSYINFAVPILLNHSDDDAEAPRESTFYRWEWNTGTSKSYNRSWDSFAAYLTLNHILYENSPRYVFIPGTKAWRCRDNYKSGNPEPEQREEAFPELWEQHPETLLKLLLESNCRPVHHFAAKALRVCQSFSEGIDLDILVQLLNKPYEVTVEFGFELVRQRYNPNDPNLELVQTLANCAFQPARIQAHQWIEQARERFLGSVSFIVSLIFSPYSDTRLFARNLLSSALLLDDTAKVLIGRIIAELLACTFSPNHEDREGQTAESSSPSISLQIEGETREISTESIQDVGETLLLCFAPQLRTIGFNIIRDLLEHPIVEVQEIGARILLNHETPATELPLGLIDSLMTSPHEAIRVIGVRIFGQLPDETLLQEYNVLAAIATSALPDLRQSVRPVIQRLASSHPDFAAQLATELIDLLFVPEQHEGIHQDIVVLLRDYLPGWMAEIRREMAMKLLRAKSSAAQELGGLALNQHCADWVTEFTTAEIVKLASHEVLSVREAARSMFLQILDRIRTDTQELLSAARLLEAKWEDSRSFAREVFGNFSSAEWTPEVMVSICDSVREDVRQFGRDVVINHFQQEYGQDYLLKFSEHPSADMQVFATNYLEEYAAGSCDRLRQLSPYFITVLSQINRGRVAKDRVFAFLAAEAQKSEEAARIVADILTQQSLTIAIGDKATAVQTMLKIKQQYPQINLPLQIQPVTKLRT